MRHRFKIALTLAKKIFNSYRRRKLYRIIKTDGGKIQNQVRTTDYSS